jgi:hypothetical protein
MRAPLPIPRGLFAEVATGKRVFAAFQKHHADAGETGADDCYITISEKLDCGDHGCGESGLYPVENFKNQFRFLEPPKPMGAFGK